MCLHALVHLYRKTCSLFRAKIVSGAEKGFTLMEVLAAVSVFALIMGSVFSLYIFGINTYKAGSNRVDLQQNIRLASDFITRELRYAHTFAQISEHEIRYSIYDSESTYTIKYKDGEIVQLIGGTEEKIAYAVETLRFGWDGANAILNFSISGIADGNSYALRSAVCLRNLRERW